MSPTVKSPPCLARTRPRGAKPRKRSAFGSLSFASSERSCPGYGVPAAPPVPARRISSRHSASRLCTAERRTSGCGLGTNAISLALGSRTAAVDGRRTGRASPSRGSSYLLRRTRGSGPPVDLGSGGAGVGSLVIGWCSSGLRPVRRPVSRRCWAQRSLVQKLVSGKESKVRPGRRSPRESVGATARA